MGKPLVHTPEGVRDIYGEEYRIKLLVEEKMHRVLSSYGYHDIQTPTFEFFDVFSREIGTTPSRELYKFFDKEGNTLVLRPDFTPSMARCAAKYYRDEKLPIRFSYQGNTFTNTGNLQGKLKEVTQLGAELMQEPSVQADAELIALTVEALRAAGLEEFQISIGHVEYFRGICSQAGLDSDTEEELRELISSKNFFGAQELLERRKVRRDYCDVFMKVYDLFGTAPTLAQARSLVNNERSLQAVERLEQLYAVLCSYGVEKYVSFDLGLLSKYHYYTGIVFKAYTYGVGDAIAKGGRYDRLLEYFGKQASAIGFVILVDDLLEALTRQNKRPVPPSGGSVILYEEGSFDRALSMARRLRSEGKAAEMIPFCQTSNPISANESGDLPYENTALEACLEAARSHGQSELYLLRDNGQDVLRRIEDDKSTVFSESDGKDNL